MNYRKTFLLFFSFSVACGVSSQVVIPDSTIAYHNDIIRATLNRIEHLHYHPRPMDSVYSQRVWNNFIRQLDPDHDIFLQKDIDEFGADKYTIGSELQHGSSKFYNEVYSRYCKRIGEVASVCKDLLKKPFDFQKNESFNIVRKDLPFPASDAQRTDIWRKAIKYAILKHYMEGDSVLSKTAINSNQLDSALERNSEEYVEKWYADYFHNAVQVSTLDEKFALYLNTALSEIDPHTAYVAPKDKSFEALITKKFYGIGVELGQKGLDLYIKRVMHGGPAYNSGKIKENDVIMAIADSKGQMQNVSGMAPTQVANLIRGEDGTDITIQVAQSGETPRTVVLRRGEVIDMQNRAKSAIIESNGKKIGYLYLPLFYLDAKGDGRSGAGFDVAIEVMKLQENQVDGIIVDLRNNLGGALPEVVKMCGTFLPPTPAVTYLKDKDTVNGMGFERNGMVYYDGPLVVLVDENTASASEIFSAAMQDFHRAIIVGTSSTFGKGTAQTVLNMGKLGNPADGIPDISYGSMRLTEKKFYRVTGISTQLVGVKPDIVLQDRMLLNGEMEKDYVSALKSDTIKLPAFQPVPISYDYNKVVADAKARIMDNLSFKSIAVNMKELRALNAAPKDLNIGAFKNEYNRIKDVDGQIQKSQVLPSDKRLDVEAAQFQSIRPGTIKADPRDVQDYNDWMQKLSKDIYLEETVHIINDIIANYKN